MMPAIQNVWELTKGIRLQLIMAVVLIVIVIIVAISYIFQPTPTNELSPNEQTYPQATPQPFRHQEAKDTGTLVVTSNVPGAIVLLDAEEHPSPEDPIKPGQKWPHNTTPFTVRNMPVGDHVLFAIKPPQYDMGVFHFVIRKDEVTRVYIELEPLQLSE